MSGIIGIDVGGTRIKYAVMDGERRLRFEGARDTPPETDLIGALCGIVARLKSAAGPVAAVGIGCPGIIDDDGRILHSNNIRLKNFNLRTETETRTGLPTAVLNDANCAALAEYACGAGAGVRNMAMLTVGTGVGCALILNGELYKGFHACAAGGHVTVERAGKKCNCNRGSVGCLEQYASATALLASAKRAARRFPDGLLNRSLKNGGQLTGAAIFAAEAAGDPAAKRCVEEFIVSLGAGVATILNLLRPERIVIGGGVSAQGAALTDRLAAYAKDKTFAAFELAPYEIVPAALGNAAGTLGAALYAEKICR
ncbi:MAG: ROK family protein [Clostridiales bacterium]|jgi:glucokinase|nr:ROK family protein [Clostridiales bacterium]